MLVYVRRSDRPFEDVSHDLGETLSLTETVRPKTAPARPDRAEEERMSLFWRVFGGTLVSIVALVAITLFNNLSNTLSEMRTEIARLNEARADVVKKDEFNARTTGVWDRVQAVQSPLVGLTAGLTNLQTELTGLKERLVKLGLDLEAMRKEGLAAQDAVKKDLAAIDPLKERVAVLEGLKKEVAAIDVVREKLAALAADVKGLQDDLRKVRADVDRNLVADEERKTRRDALQAQTDEALKDLSKRVQDCREKLARMEGLMPPAKPAPDKKPGD
jgi:predicted  nucleic acid-binding Zn-ribbon protein